MALRWTAAAVLALALGAGTVEAAPLREESALERVFAPPRTTAEVRRRLFALEAGELPAAFRLLAAGELATARVRIVLNPAERELVRECLTVRPRREIVGLLEGLASRPMDAPSRREAQRLLGAVGSAEHMKLLARLTVSSPDRGPLTPDLRYGFTAALDAILARDASALAHCVGLFSDTPASLSSSIVEAVAAQRKEGATRVLAELLGRSPGLDPLLLARLSDRGRARTSGDEAVLDSVRRYLRQRDPALVAAAARACGRLGDDGAVEALIGLLDHGDERVRTCSFQALREVTGLDFPAEAERWSRWLQDETRWWDEHAEEELVHVERGRGVEFARAARSVLEHRLYRGRIAEAFVETLRRGGPTEARMACSALAQLGSPVAVRPLVEFLEHPDAALRDAAWRALRAITGTELPPEADSWAALAN